jgi:hypothetical protein
MSPAKHLIEFDNLLSRIHENLIDRVGRPMKFRLIADDPSLLR